MDWRPTSAAAPLLVGVVLLLWIVGYVLWRRPERARRSVVLLCLAIALYAFGYAAELGSASREQVAFWLKVEYLGIANVPFLVLLVALAWAGRERLLSPPLLAPLLVVPWTTCVLAWTNETHRRIWREIRIDASGSFTRTFLERGSWFWVHNAFIYAMLGAAIVVVVVELRRRDGVFRRQAAVMLGGVAVPILVHLAYIVRPRFGGLDPNPYALLVTAVALSWGVIELRLWDLVPVARDAVVASMAEVALVVDGRGRIVDANPAARRLLGSDTRILGQPVVEALPELAGLALEPGPAAPPTEIDVERNGERRHFEVGVTALRAGDARAGARLLLLHETTERRRAEQALRDSEALLRRLYASERRARETAETLAAANLALAQRPELDAILDALLEHLERLVPCDSATVMLLEGGSRLVVAAQRGYQRWGDPEAVLRISFDAGRNRYLGQMLRDAAPRVVADTVADPNWERLAASAHVRCWLGVPLVVRGQVVGVFSADKREPGSFDEEHVRLALGLVPAAATAIEFTRTLQALRESNSRYEAAVQASGRMIYDWNPETNAVAYGGNMVQTIGYEPGELAGGLQRWLELVHPEDRDAFGREIDRVVATREPFRLQYRVRRKDGSYVSVADDGHFFRGGADQPLRMVGFVEDVTERLRLEEQLRQSLKMEAVGRLAGGIAHDFNNILNVIMGYAELLQRSAGEGQQRRRIDQIQRAAGRAAGLTRQLLAFSRKQVLKPRVLELDALLADTQKMLGRMIGEDVELSLKLGSRGPVRVDVGQVEQVLMNLAVNARDAMPGGGVLTIETRDVELGVDSERPEALAAGRYVLLSVSDTGHGMDEATRLRIFEPFFTTKPEGEGTGLGLATVYGIVEQSGGHVVADSEVGRGTRFRIYFPRVDASLDADAATRPEERTPPRHETVLVVEDEPAARELIGEVLRAEGYSVLLAGDGQQALEVSALNAARIQLLLTDVVLPKLGGRAVSEQIAPQQPGLKVLFMSGYSRETLSRQGILDTGIRLLEKPFLPGELLRRVHEVLEAG